MRFLWAYHFLSFGVLGFSKLLHSIDGLKNTKYDFVIAGAGTAGSVLANRLSEDGSYRVLVIEAGVDNANIQNIIVPFIGPTALNTIVDWNFTSSPQVGLFNRTIPLERGHVLGGSSSINFMAWNRGSDDLWDNFARLSNDSGWSWSSVAKFDLKVSRLTPPTDGRNTTGEVIPSVHGNGPVLTSLPGYPSEIDPLVVGTAKSLGGRFKYNEDNNAGDMIGFGHLQSSVGNGERSSAATAYLVPAINRPNLDVVINSRALKLYASQTAVDGVPKIDILEVAQSANGPRVNVTGTKEVILSAGVFGTPQILLLSGIGPKEELTKLNIPVLLESPDVGKHLTDHPLLPGYFVVDSHNGTDPIQRNSTLLAELLQEWETSRTGIMVNPAGGGMVAFLKNPPDFFGGFDPSSGPRSGNTEMIFGLYTTDYDIQSMIQVMKDVDNFLSQPAWNGFVLRPLFDFANDDEREIFARNNSRTVDHCIGTARMGPGGVEGGVVDSQLRVKGVKGLRVVDASVFPQIPENHPQAVAYILAERASDLIKSSH
ncbi:hypothetical protein V5O48_006889 [Marasmius crinis-equi]|uniref:Aryl-alcohol oxidase n=1 Tax=Marasmius crinis-equi TaxID=585013 RepID=A0ABR3FI87_9AGAR